MPVPVPAWGAGCWCRCRSESKSEPTSDAGAGAGAGLKVPGAGAGLKVPGAGAGQSRPAPVWRYLIAPKKWNFRVSNEWPMNSSLKKKKPVTLTGDLKFRRKINWFVTGTFCFVTAKNQKLSRALLQICKNCHGHLSFFTGIFLAFLSRVTSQFSRAKFGVFCHGHFFKITGIFSKSVTGKP